MPNFEILRALMHVIITCKFEKDRMKNSQEKVATPFSPIITLWGLYVAMETRVLIQSGPKHYATLPIISSCEPSAQVSYQTAASQKKPASGVSNQGRHTPNCANTKHGLWLEINKMCSSFVRKTKPEDQWSCKRSPNILA